MTKISAQDEFQHELKFPYDVVTLRNIIPDLNWNFKSDPAECNREKISAA